MMVLRASEGIDHRRQGVVHKMRRCREPEPLQAAYPMRQDDQFQPSVQQSDQEPVN